MKTLIVYFSKYGTTQECVNLLLKELNGDVESCNIDNGKISIDSFDTIIIGSPVYIGHVNKKITKFIANNKTRLMEKKLALFVSCLTPSYKKDFYEDLFDKDIINHAICYESFGGKLPTNAKGFDKFVINAISKSKDASSSFASSGIAKDRIESFAKKVIG